MGDNIILGMIESVDFDRPAWEACLNEIDARVHVYVSKPTCVYHSGGHSYYWYHENWVAEKGAALSHIFESDFHRFWYTRSRDALKQIRPDGYTAHMTVDQMHDHTPKGIVFTLAKNGKGFNSPILPTEELAELHAIIQAIEYERTK